MILLALLLALFQSSFPTTREPPIVDHERYRCDGVVLRDPELRPQGIRLDVALEACGEGLTSALKPLNETVRLFVRGNPEEFFAGDRIRFWGKLSAPRDYQNPGSFSFQNYLAARNIAMVGSVSDPSWIVRREAASSAKVVDFVHVSRRAISRAIDRFVTEEGRGIVKALSIGSREGIDLETRDLLSLLGVSHLLAISGLHVGFGALLVGIMIAALLRRFPKLFLHFPLWKGVGFLSLPFIWFFIALAGAPVSAVRAGIMLTLFTLGYLIDRRQDLLSTLSLAAICIMLLWPHAVFNVSFQLTIVTVAGIILITPSLQAWIRAPWCERWLPRYAASLIAVTFAATLASFPIVAFFFHLVAPLGLLVNLVAVPLVGFFLVPPIFIAMGATLLLPGMASWCWMIAGEMATFLLRMSEFLRPLAESAALHYSPPLWKVWILYGLFGFLLFHRKLHIRGRAAFAVALILFIIALPLRFPHKGLEVIFFDVGQGDAALVQFPNGERWMIDGGGIRRSDFDIGRMVIAPALWRMGMYRLDALLVSHPHHDHYGGFASIIEEFRPIKLMTNGKEPPEEERESYDALMQRAAQHGVEVVHLHASQPAIEIGGVLVKILSPWPHDLSHLSENESSLLLSLEYEGERFLFTGDLGKYGESMLMGSEKLQPHTVLKVGHHGSNTSTHDPFLEKVKPQVAVISVGAGNAYGMPNQKVLDRLTSQGTRIYRTDLDGALRFVVNKKGLTISKAR